MQSAGSWNETVNLAASSLVNSALRTKIAEIDSNIQLLVVALIAGVTTHLGYFIRGEHHTGTTTIVKSYAALDLLILGLLIKTNGGCFRTATIEAIIVTTAYFVGLFGSMAIYRAFFHPLRHFRGPFIARLSNLYHSSLLGNSDNYRVIYNLHRQYGPIVRTGMFEKLIAPSFYI